MGRPKISKVYPHPLDDAFHLYRISCCIGYIYDTIKEYICKKCGDSQGLRCDFKYGHGFLDGNLYPPSCSNCEQCLVKTRPIIECDRCRASYTHCLENLQTQDIHRENIIDLLYDVLRDRILYLNIKK